MKLIVAIIAHRGTRNKIHIGCSGTGTLRDLKYATRAKEMKISVLLCCTNYRHHISFVFGGVKTFILLQTAREWCLWYAENLPFIFHGIFHTSLFRLQSNMTAPCFGLLYGLKMNYLKNCRVYAVTKRTDAIIAHIKHSKLKSCTREPETTSEIFVLRGIAVSNPHQLPQNSVASASPIGQSHTETLRQDRKKHLTRNKNKSRVVIIYRRFGTTYRSHLHGSRFVASFKKHSFPIEKRWQWMYADVK
jgi:hypothetical protein